MPEVVIPDDDYEKPSVRRKRKLNAARRKGRRPASRVTR
jgi:ribosomal protein S21